MYIVQCTCPLPMRNKSTIDEFEWREFDHEFRLFNYWFRNENENKIYLAGLMPIKN